MSDELLASDRAALESLGRSGVFLGTGDMKWKHVSRDRTGTQGLGFDQNDSLASRQVSSVVVDRMTDWIYENGFPIDPLGVDRMTSEVAVVARTELDGMADRHKRWSEGLPKDRAELHVQNYPDTRGDLSKVSLRAFEHLSELCANPDLYGVEVDPQTRRTGALMQSMLSGYRMSGMDEQAARRLDDPRFHAVVATPARVDLTPGGVGRMEAARQQGAEAGVTGIEVPDLLAELGKTEEDLLREEQERAGVPEGLRAVTGGQVIAQGQQGQQEQQRDQRGQPGQATMRDTPQAGGSIKDRMASKMADRDRTDSQSPQDPPYPPIADHSDQPVGRDRQTPLTDRYQGNAPRQDEGLEQGLDL